MKNIRSTVVIFCLLWSCANDTQNNEATTLKEEIILSESGDSLLVVYWENGSRKQETKLKSGKKNGEEKYYDQAGSLRAKGEVINGLKSGIWEFFDAHGYLESIYEFKIIDAKSEANRYWKIGENGDTIIDESNFYEASFIFDTIAFGDFTALNIRLTKPFFGDEVGLLIGDFNEDFSNMNCITVDSVMMSKNHEFQFYIFSYGKDEVPVRAIIVDMKHDNVDSGQMRKMYVEETFFVK